MKKCSLICLLFFQCGNKSNNNSDDNINKKLDYALKLLKSLSLLKSILIRIARNSLQVIYPRKSMVIKHFLEMD